MPRKQNCKHLSPRRAGGGILAKRMITAVARTAVRLLAEKIADDLMTGMSGKAHRLVLEMPGGKDGGGWGKGPLTDRIEGLLLGER